jgi:iron complex outermembrane receptor protein
MGKVAGDLRPILMVLLSGTICATCPTAASAQQKQRVPDATGTSAAPPNAEQPDIIVTAQKREERLQDVPAAVSALSAASLTSDNRSRLRDYFDTVPGFQLSPYPGGGGQQTLAIRGVSSGSGANPTVGIMVDDVPFGAATYDFSPDIDPSDLQRIEVLRGPQGTLYGASSMGGLIKYVTLEPSTTALSGRMEAGIEGVSNSDDVGYVFRGGLNVPLSDALAVRVTGFTRREAGYMDNPLLGRADVNSARTSGVHGSVLLKIGPNISIKLSALYQRFNADGTGEDVVRPGLSRYQQDYILNTGQSSKTTQAYSATIRAALGPIDLTSVTGYTKFRATQVQDYSKNAPWGGLANSLFGVAGAPSFFDARVRRVTQEVRATFQTGPRLDWLIGGFYSDENTPIGQRIRAENTTTGAILGDIITFNIPFKYREFALFADPTLHLTDRFSVQFGARYSWTHSNFESVTEQGKLLPATVVLPAVVKSERVFTYLVTPQFRVNPDLMVYARVATGYRPGRSNSFNSDITIPRAANADKTTNYEIGVKGNAFSRMLTYEVSLYYIDWSKVQLTLISASNSLAYTANAGRAKSRGGEVSLTLRPGAGITLSGWVSVSKANLTEGVVNSATFAPDGALLPYTARFTANLSADKKFEISNGVSGLLGATFGHVGKRFGTFIATPARDVYPAYNKLDLRAGLNWDSWALTVYARNVGNSRGVLGGGAGSYPPNAFIFLQPRTLGASLSKTF